MSLCLQAILFSSYMIPNRVPGSTLDIKQSTFKKMTKFFKSLEKQQLLNTKEMTELFVMSFNRAHALVTSFHPRKSKKTQEPIRLVYEKIDLFGLPKSGPLTKAPGFEMGQYYTRAQIKSLLDGYFQQQALVQPHQPRMIKLDHFLSESVSKKEYVDVLARDEILQRFMAAMDPYHQITKGDQAIVYKGEFKPLVISKSKKSGREKTTLAHYETLVDAGTFVSEFRVRFGSSATSNFNSSSYH